jgi:hypothetical protein
LVDNQQTETAAIEGQLISTIIFLFS